MGLFYIKNKGYIIWQSFIRHSEENAMNVKREILPLVITVLFFAMLACNLPGTSFEGSETIDPASEPAGTSDVIVENTVTSIPTETPVPPTSTPSISPEITLTNNSNCRLGPSTNYNIVDQISQSKVLPVIGRNENATWWQVVNATGRECWIFNENATPNTDFSGLTIGSAPSLPGIPVNFSVGDQLCQPGANKFTVTLRWSSGGGETAFRLFRDGKQIIEVKAGKFNYKDASAPLNKNLTYEIEAINGNGTSERAVQVVTACK
jgi:hypothetical protein